MLRTFLLFKKFMLSETSLSETSPYFADRVERLRDKVGALRVKTNNHPLAGLHFIAPEKHWKGMVTGIIGDDFVLVDLYDWQKLEPLHSSLVSIKEIATAGWELYSDLNVWKSL
jgi:hypothetical protein